MTSPSILIVDDFPAVGAALRVAFSLDGRFLVAGVARSVAEALGMLQTCQPDAVILDLTLPDARGREAPQRLREQTDLPILIYSAMTGLGDQDTAGLADATVRKSGDTDELLDTLQQLLDSR